MLEPKGAESQQVPTGPPTTKSKTLVVLTVDRFSSGWFHCWIYCLQPRTVAGFRPDGISRVFPDGPWKGFPVRKFLLVEYFLYGSGIRLFWGSPGVGLIRSRAKPQETCNCDQCWFDASDDGPGNHWNFLACGVFGPLLPYMPDCWHCDHGRLFGEAPFP